MCASESIAIDGPAASGKTIVGKLLARHLGHRFLDTGNMYRAITWGAISHNIKMDDSSSLSKLASTITLSYTDKQNDCDFILDGENITKYLRNHIVEQNVSMVSKLSKVRAVLVDKQRTLAKAESTVMAGRDIGTVVLTNAALKIFLLASVEIRALRRLNELHEDNRTLTLDDVVDDLTRRDNIDKQRSHSPMRPAKDAIQIDTDNLAVSEVVEKILVLIDH